MPRWSMSKKKEGQALLNKLYGRRVRPRVSKKKAGGRRSQPGSITIYLWRLKLLANALYEIRYYQKTTGTIIPCSPFQRLIHGICLNDVLAKSLRFSTEALAAFQTAAEHYICTYFELLYIFISVFANSSQLAALHAKRQTVMVRDSAFVHQVVAIIDPASPLGKKPERTITENRRPRSIQSSGRTGHRGKVSKTGRMGTKTVPGSGGKGRGKSLPLITRRGNNKPKGMGRR
jgi:histone H3/H4